MRAWLGCLLPALSAVLTVVCGAAQATPICSNAQGDNIDLITTCDLVEDLDSFSLTLSGTALNATQKASVSNVGGAFANANRFWSIDLVLSLEDDVFGDVIRLTGTIEHLKPVHDGEEFGEAMTIKDYVQKLTVILPDSQFSFEDLTSIQPDHGSSPHGAHFDKYRQVTAFGFDGPRSGVVAAWSFKITGQHAVPEPPPLTLLLPALAAACLVRYRQPRRPYSARSIVAVAAFSASSR